ncbi:hypothetical protein RZS08_30985, partial [Arthrospira platensis SPKY1]|nr:hypothetical protein [Arthrospira platensis SPKY1]
MLDSSLQGMAIGLPSPFLKASADRVPLLIEMVSIPNTRIARDQVVLQLGDSHAPWLAARYLREEQQGQMQVLRGAVGVNTRAPSLPSSGIVADIQLDAIDTDSWSQLF